MRRNVIVEIIEDAFAAFSGEPHQGLSDADDGARLDPWAQRKPVWREHEYSRAVLEPAHLLALPKRCVTGERRRLALARVERGFQREL